MLTFSFRRRPISAGVLLAAPRRKNALAPSRAQAHVHSWARKSRSLHLYKRLDFEVSLSRVT